MNDFENYSEIKLRRKIKRLTEDLQDACATLAAIYPNSITIEDDPTEVLDGRITKQKKDLFELDLIRENARLTADLALSKKRYEELASFLNPRDPWRCFKWLQRVFRRRAEYTLRSAFPLRVKEKDGRLFYGVDEHSRGTMTMESMNGKLRLKSYDAPDWSRESKK